MTLGRECSATDGKAAIKTAAGGPSLRRSRSRCDTPHIKRRKTWRAMNSSVKKRSVAISSHKTSISLEDIFWTSLKEIARQRATTLDVERNGSNLSPRLVLNHYCDSVAPYQILPVNVRNLPMIDISLTN
jgi:hypothetical protein